MTARASPTLARVTARWPRLPFTLTISRDPPREMSARSGRAERSAVLALGRPEETEISLHIDGDDQPPATFGAMPDAVETILTLASDGLILRFPDAAAVDRTLEDAPDLVQHARLIWLRCAGTQRLLDCAKALARFGFRHRTSFSDTRDLLLSRIAIPLERQPDYAERSRLILRRLVLIDNNLVGERGHFLPVASLISRGADEAGVQVIWAANERLDPSAVPKGVELDSAFTHCNFDIAVVGEAEPDLSSEFQQGLEGVLTRHGADGTHFLIPTLDGNHIRAVFRLLQRKLSFQGFLHLCTPYEPRQMPSPNGRRELDWYLARIREHPLFGVRVFLWAETQVLADALSERLSCRVERLSLPAPQWPIAKTAVGSARPPLLTFLGAARVDKGILELPEIVARIYGDALTARDLRIDLRVTPPHGGYTRQIGGALDRLREFPAVTVTEGLLDAAEYRAAMLASDGLLIPYRAGSYALRGSNIIVEGIASGCVILAPTNTVAEELADQGQILLCSSPDDWGTAAADFVARRAALMSEARKRATAFQKRNAPRTVVDRLAYRVEFERQNEPRPD